MFRKTLFALLLLISVCAAAFAQDNKVERKFDFVFIDEAGYLGVQAQDVTKENFSKFGLAKVQGVAIEKVLENSPAANAGLQAGDVILRFNNEEVTSVRKLTRLIGEVAPDHQITLAIVRAGGEREVNVTLGKRPADLFEFGKFDMRVPMPQMQMPQMPQMPPIGNLPRMREIPVPNEGDLPVAVWRFGGRQIGVGATPLTKQLADYMGINEDKGLLITEVRENSPAARAGLKAGDVIVEADGKEVKGQMDLMRAINEKKEGDISLTIVRDKNRQTVRVTPEVSKDDMKPFENFVKPADLPQMNLQPVPKMPNMPALPSMPVMPTRIL
jgi:serine protease Do